MIRFVGVFLLLVFSTQVQSQQLLADIWSDTNYLDSVSVFPVGDSVLVKYKKSRALRSRFTYEWISAGGKRTPFNYWQDIRAVHATDRGVHLFYFFKEPQGLVVRELIQNGKQFQASGKTVVITNKIIGGFSDVDGYYILARDSLKNQLEIIQIPSIDSVSRHLFELPPDFMSSINMYGASRVCVENRLTNFFAGGMGVDFFKRGRKLFITEAWIRNQRIEQDFLVLNLDDGSQKIVTRLLEATPSVATFLADDKFFSYTATDSAMIVAAYDLKSGALLTTDRIKQFPDSFAFYTRIGKGLKTLKDSSAIDIRKWHRNVQTLSIFKDSIGTYYLRCGSFTPDQQNIGVLPIMPFPLLSLMIFAATTAAFEAGDMDGVSRYFYYKFEDGNLQLVKKPDHVFQRLDDFEVHLQQAVKMKVRDKSYVDFNGGILAVLKTKRQVSLRFFR